MHRLAGTRDGGGSDSEDDALPELHRAPRSPNRNHPEEEETHRTCVWPRGTKAGCMSISVSVKSVTRYAYGTDGSCTFSAAIIVHWAGIDD